MGTDAPLQGARLRTPVLLCPGSHEEIHRRMAEAQQLLLNGEELRRWDLVAQGLEVLRAETARWAVCPDACHNCRMRIYRLEEEEGTG